MLSPEGTRSLIGAQKQPSTKLACTRLFYVCFVLGLGGWSQLSNAIDLKPILPNAELLKSFDGPQGWRGHISQNPSGIRVIVWEAPDGLVAIGKLLDANGRDINKLAQEKYATNAVAISVLSKMGVASSNIASADSKPHSVEALAYVELLALDSAHYTTVKPSHFEEGAVVQEMFAFYDYNCPYCATAFNHLSSSGYSAKVHWLPVSILGSSSAQYGAAVLEGSIDIDHMGKQSGQKYPTPKSPSMQSVANNTALLKAMMGRASTPFFLRKKNNGEVVTLSGFSEAAPAALKQMLNEEE